MTDPRDDTTDPTPPVRHEIRDERDDATPPHKPNSGSAAPIDGNAWE